MNHFFGYIRVSTVKQGEHGVSLQEQRDGIARYATRNGFEIGAWFEERETAAKHGRPVFNEMMRRLRKREAEGVIIHKIDRSARNLKDWTAIEELADKGIAVHFVSESLDLRSTGGRLAADVQAVVAAHYVRNLREETRKGFYGRLKQGIYPLRAPVGYLDRGGGKPKDIDPASGPLVRKAFELYASGRHTLATLCEEMRRLGLTNRNGKPVSLNGFSVMLNNPFYIGVIRLRKTGETFAGAHEPLITTSVFDRVRAVLEGRTNFRIRGEGFVLRRLLTCRFCDYSLIAERQKGYVYYRCHTKDCPTLCVREDVVLEEIRRTMVKPVRLSPAELREAQEILLELRKDWAKEQSAQGETLKMQVGQVTGRLARLTDAFLDGTIEKDLFDERKAALLLERRKLEEAFAQVEANPAGAMDRAEEFLELCGTAEILYESAVPEEKRDLVALLTSNRHVEGKKLDVTWAPPFDLIAERNSVTSCGLQRYGPRTWKRLLGDLIEWFQKNPGMTFAVKHSRVGGEEKEEDLAA